MAVLEPAVNSARVRDVIEWLLVSHNKLSVFEVVEQRAMKVLCGNIKKTMSYPEYNSSDANNETMKNNEEFDKSQSKHTITLVTHHNTRAYM